MKAVLYSFTALRGAVALVSLPITYFLKNTKEVGGHLV